MPKFEIVHSAGFNLPKELRDLLLKYLDLDEVSRIERLGGKITISISSPFILQVEKSESKFEVDVALVNEIRNLEDKPSKIKELLSNLSVKQLRKLGKSVGHPVKTKSTREEIISELVTFFHSGEVWKRISQG